MSSAATHTVIAAPASHSSNTGPTIPSTVDVRREVESWFAAHGVPHFTDHYSVRTRGPLIDYLVFAVLAWELAVAPWREASVLAILVAPVALAAVALLFEPLARKYVRPGEKSSSHKLKLLCTAAIVPVSFILAETDLPAVWQYQWIDFATLFLLLLASALLFQLPSEAWGASDHRDGLVQIVVVVSAVLLVLVVEDTAVVGVSNVVSGQSDSTPVTIFDALASMRPLFIAVTVLVMISRVWRQVNEAGTLEVSLPEVPRAVGDQPLRIYLLSKIVPFEVLLLGGGLTTLHYALPQRLEAACPVVGMVALVLIFVATFYGSRRVDVPRSCSWIAPIRELIERPGAWTWVMLYLVSYPVLMWRFFELQAFGDELPGWQAGGLILVVNVVYLLIAWFVVGFGLDRITAWSLRALRSSLRSMFGALARGLPLLLVFATFLVLTAELWQVAAALKMRDLLLVASILVAAALVLMLVASNEEIAARQRAVTAEEAVRQLESGDLGVSDASKDVLRQLVTSGDTEPEAAAPVAGLARVNLLIVLMVYECLALVPAAVIATVLFFAIGRLAVSPELAAEWVYGDGTDPALGRTFTEAPLWDQPWSRVALLLGALSLLYLAVTVIFDTERRAEFFRGADGALRQRLAMRKVYMEHLAPTSNVPVSSPT